MTFRIETQVSEDYERLFLSDAGATVFHHPDFLRAYEPAFGGKLEIWWLGDDCACPFVVKRKGPYASASSGGYGCYGGPVGKSERFPDFMRLARESGFSRLEMVDFRNRLPSVGFRILKQTAHMLELPDSPDRLLALYSNLRRREIRNEFQVSAGANPSEFYRLHNQTFSSLKTWVTPEEAIVALSGSEIARFYTARIGDEVMGVLLVLSCRDEAMWWISGRKPGAEGVMTHLLHKAISDAISEGRKVFNFGATHAGGPARFKESFAARPYSYRSLVSEKGVFALLRKMRRRQ
ncbi:MAG: GNAT family N-acetyltransferase [candidate division WOR-3 bacterium]